MSELTILTVCSGNICRSPLAEQLIRARTRDLPDAPAITVVSAGTYALDGDTMHAKSQEVARQLGITDAHGHRARYLAAGHLRDADLVLAMARMHRRQIVSQEPRATKRTFTLREFARLADAVTDEQLLGAFAAVPPAAPLKDRLTAALELLASHRGQSHTAAHPDEDDVLDPYQRGDDAFQLSTQQILPGVEAVVRVVELSVRAVA